MFCVLKRASLRIVSLIVLSFLLPEYPLLANTKLAQVSSPARTRIADSTRQPVRPERRDSDGDGVSDIADRCQNTPRGVKVNQQGCPLDSDRDGITDDRDDCPQTSPAAASSVDMFGCPLDSDFDGIADHEDACPHNPAGAHVGENGCPIDHDGDGVADGLDDCPDTFPGLDVDRFGCLDLSLFAQPFVLLVDYPPGGFDIDPRSAERLRRLARMLSFAPDVSLEVAAHTDDVGTNEANMALSRKRAERVRDFLASEGVATNRMKAIGKGETESIAGNETAEGRKKNRRIHITFSR